MLSVRPVSCSGACSSLLGIDVAVVSFASWMVSNHNLILQVRETLIYLVTVLCKSNESELQRISSIVLANFQQYVGKILRGISRGSMRYFEESGVK